VPQEPFAALEWPGEVRDLPAADPGAWWLLAALAVALGWWCWRRSGTRPPVPSPAAAPASPSALERLRALGLPGDGTTDAAFFGAVKALLRQHCTERFGVRGDTATSEELLQATPAADRLAPCLGLCDGVLFAAQTPGSDAAARCRELAIAYAEATAAEAAS
jgi:hypothetical protein